MYIQYFGLRDLPFSITPDPAYLYMSPRHQEALGHLLYGTGQYGGFVQLTGEVGTGKTTVVRTLLEQKIEGVDVAMIYNPRQSEREFLASVCDELGAPYTDDASLKHLVDALNRHLLEAHAAGRRTVLIIDEAQNLEPGVLEQVRLLTNLETHKDKLLRIMLVGQPELAELLARPDLRQLAQRITARYHLTPLSEPETREYIRHRVRVAGGTAELFSDDAIREVQLASRGVPRLINIICDRALLGTFGAHARSVTGPMVRRAAAESMADAHGSVPRPTRWSALLDAIEARIHLIETALAVLAVVLVLLLIQRTWQGVAAPASEPDSAASTDTAEAPPEATTTPVPTAAPAAAPVAATAPFAVAQRPLDALFRDLAALWPSAPAVEQVISGCRTLSDAGHSCYRGSADWNTLRRLDLPAVLELDNDGAPTHVLLRWLDETEAGLQTPDGIVTVPLDRIDSRWDGRFLMLWQQPTEAQLINRSSQGDDVLWLRKRFATLSGRRAESNLSPFYDRALADTVRTFQLSEGLLADGVVGVHTLIAMTRGQPGVPTLTRADHVAAP
ncbi:AAA family ATPase [Flagellatimonas centrodinii]|uniref:AAA family ATPase n=1 Tax=Flagellatimonas centrodinii TaxID=2806210 RepID=UPI001FEFBBEA|nr:AAA family ATPase [Flagellatimonas centrodinii]ULQ47001.1 AAA family ATPase [Flagellatimonas centrodinii]